MMPLLENIARCEKSWKHVGKLYHRSFFLFITKVCPQANGCWHWLGHVRKRGYGQFQSSGKHIGAHVYSYETFIGKVPFGYEIDHLCRNPRCVNPNHLEAVTHRVNILRGTNPPSDNSRKTHCKNGHALIGDNLVLDQLKKGSRLCRTCRNEWQRNCWARRRALAT